MYNTSGHFVSWKCTTSPGSYPTENRSCRKDLWVWRKVFPLSNEFKAQRELGAWLTIKLGKTRLKRQLACGEEPSLLSRSGIRPLTGTAVDKTEQNLVPTAFILQRINSNNSGRTRRNNRRCNRKISSKQLTYIRFSQPLNTKEYDRNINRNHLELNEN